VTPEDSLKYIFVGGKGGVGKTVVAAALALEAARRGRRTLLASLNPVHSLTSLLGHDFSGGVIKQVRGVDGLWALEVEIEDLVASYQRSMEARLREFFRWAEVPINPEPFIKIATTNPAFQESAMFDKVMDLIVHQSRDFDLIVFDTAAVANAARLIGLSKLYGLWLARMIQSRREAQELRLRLSVRKEKVAEEIRRDPVIADLIGLHEKFNRTREVLTDARRTAFYFVTTPESLPISVVSRFMKMVEAFNIPVGGLYVNMVLDPRDAAADPSGYLASKLEEQQRYLELIWRDMGDKVRGIIRMFPHEIRGVDALQLVIEDMHHYRGPSGPRGLHGEARAGPPPSAA
jgi:arsenite-transporting ATPase